MTNTDIKIQLCRDDFYLMMRDALVQAGGADNVQQWKNMSLDRIVDTLAQNGIRMVHMPEKHMDSVKVVWESPKAKKTDITLPRKKQLLCDSLDKGDEDEWTKDDMGT